MKTATIIEVRNGRPRLAEVSVNILANLKNDPSFYGEIVRFTGFGADVLRPDGTVEKFTL